MIRFVDIRGQGTCNRFAFWDTVTSKFLEFNGEQAWIDKDDFLECLDAQNNNYSVDRFVGLMPDWALYSDVEYDDLPLVAQILEDYRDGKLVYRDAEAK